MVLKCYYSKSGQAPAACIFHKQVVPIGPVSEGCREGVESGKVAAFGDVRQRT